MKINLGFNSKRYNRDMSFDNNTTYGFGEVQPLMCQFMSPDSDIKVSGKTLVRLSPLKFPSFARVKLELVSRFVPMTEVFAPFESLLSNIPYASLNGTYIPQSVPTILSNVLMLYLIRYSEVTLYSSTRNPASPNLSVVDSKITPLGLEPALSKKLLLDDFTSCKGLFDQELFKYRTNAVTFSGSDYVIEFNIGSDTKTVYSLCCRLLPSGQRLRKIFVGLGYEPLTDNHNNEPLLVSILPLLAFYKAYFETYYPQRYIGFTNTSCYALIDLLSHRQNTLFSKPDDYTNEVFLSFKSFINNLSDCFYAAPDDYISIHTSDPLTLTENNMASVVTSSSGNPEIISLGLEAQDPTGAGLPSLQYTNNISAALLKTLRVFTNFVSKDSVIGRRMSLWVKQHFNADVSNQLFKDCNFVGRHTIPLNISDVFSTSDTAQGSGADASGEHLGAFAGKGIGFGDTSFKFHSPVHGYFFIFACIVPESRTFQGVDPTLLAVSRYQIPVPDYDALGYEVTDRRVFIPSNDLDGIMGDSSSVSNGFGFVPRYTSFKYRKNISNGDMSRRSTCASMNPYYLDRIIEHNYLDEKEGIISHNDIPSASPNWRFITRYGYLGDFNRLFINSNNPEEYPNDFSVDNFISQTIFNVSLTDFLKPLKSSYDTISEDDNNVKPVTAE